MKRPFRISIGFGAVLGAAVFLAACGGGKSGTAGTDRAALREANMVYYAMPG